MVSCNFRLFKSAVLYFALVLATGFALGSIRVPFLVPRLGERYAELLEMPIMFMAIVLAAHYVVRRFSLPASLSPTASWVRSALVFVSRMMITVVEQFARSISREADAL